jgi:hypothetical protein
VRSTCRFVALAIVSCALASSPGCGERAPIPGDGRAGGPRPNESTSAAAKQLDDSMNSLVNEATVRFRALDYEYDEDLLQILDRTEASLSGKSSGPRPRALPKLDEQEEVEHFLETFRRWKAKTGKDLRTEIDLLKAEVAARKPGGPAFHPDFHKRFSAAFDDLIPIEVAEIRERRNRYIHERAKPLLDSCREKDPEAVRPFDQFLAQPPYDVSPTDSGSAKKS